MRNCKFCLFLCSSNGFFVGDIRPFKAEYKSLCFTGIKDRHGVYAMIGKNERRDVSIRRTRPSIRKQLTDSKQAASPKKAAARAKKNELEV